MISDQVFTGFIGIAIGAIGTFAALYNRITKSVTQAEALVIYNKAKAAIDEYNDAMADGTMTIEEQLNIAKNSISTLEAVIQALES